MAKKINYNNAGFAGSGRTDRCFGADNSPIEWIDYGDLDWEKHNPTAEYQRHSWGDDFSCVPRAILDDIETQIKFEYNEEVNFSDRASASMIPVVPGYGCKVYDAIESIRKRDGFLEQKDWTNDTATKAEFYIELPVNLKGKAKTNLNKYLIQYEWVDNTSPENLKKQLRNCPLCIAVYAYSKPVNGIYPRIEGESPNHYILLNSVTDTLNIFDHYQGFEYRKLALDYLMTAVLKIKVTKINMDYTKYDKKLIQNSDTGEFGWFYNNKLRTAKTNDRFALMLAAYSHRNEGGLTIDNDTWQLMPKEQF